MPAKSHAREKFGVYKGKQAPLRKAFRTNFRALRIARGATTYEMAEAVGVSQAYISELESAKEDKTPDFSMLAHIAKIFSIAPHTLLIEGYYTNGIDVDVNMNTLNALERAGLERSLKAAVKNGRARAS